jgi:SAM-dependent methyltransferase
MAQRDVPADRSRALASYRRIASAYDSATRRIERKRRRAIALLELRQGETVLDVACGTGAAFEALSEAVGPTGRVIGVEQSPEMIELARRRVAALGLGNVILIPAAVEEAAMPGPVDAVLFCYAHDVLRSPAALRNVFGAARAGARVASVGAKLFPRWLAFLDPWVRWRTRSFISTQEGLDQPWSLLAEFVPDFAVREVTVAGSGYIGAGSYSARARA